MNKSEERYLEPNVEDAKAQAARKGVKLNSNKSQFVKKMQTDEEFGKQADAYHANTIDKNQRAASLAKEFWDLIRSKELNSNKGPIAKSYEKEILDNLILYARELNNLPPGKDAKGEDLPIEEGMGSIAMIILLMKTVIYQKDLCNELEFRLNEAEKQMKKMSSAGK